MTTTTNLGIANSVENTLQPGVAFNAAMDTLDAAVAGTATRNLVADANYTLIAADYQTCVLVITDTGPVLTAGRDIVFPAHFPRVTVRNQSAQTLTLKKTGQTGVALAAGTTSTFVAGLTDVVQASAAGGSSAASGVTVADAADYFVGTDVEAVLQEVGLKLGGSKPLAASFSTFGTGITATDKLGRLQLLATSGGTLRGVSQNSIATPYTIDARIALTGTPASGDAVWAGIAVSDGTKYRTFYGGCLGGATIGGTTRSATGVNIDSWTNASTFGAGVRASSAVINSANFHVRITDSGTTRSFYLSANGLDFVLIYSEATNTYVTPTKFALVMYNNALNSLNAKASIMNWKVTASVLGDAS